MVLAAEAAEAKAPPKQDLTTQCRIEKVGAGDPRVRVTDGDGRLLISNKPGTNEIAVEGGEAGVTPAEAVKNPSALSVQHGNPTNKHTANVSTICTGVKADALGKLGGRESVVDENGLSGPVKRYGTAHVEQVGPAEKTKDEAGRDVEIARMQGEMAVSMRHRRQVEIEKAIVEAVQNKNLPELERLKGALDDLARTMSTDTLNVTYSVNGEMQKVTYHVRANRAELKEWKEFICEILRGMKRIQEAPEENTASWASGRFRLGGSLDFGNMENGFGKGGKLESSMGGIDLSLDLIQGKRGGCGPYFELGLGHELLDSFTRNGEVLEPTFEKVLKLALGVGLQGRIVLVGDKVRFYLWAEAGFSEEVLLGSPDGIKLPNGAMGKVESGSSAKGVVGGGVGLEGEKWYGEVGVRGVFGKSPVGGDDIESHGMLHVGGGIRF